MDDQNFRTFLETDERLGAKLAQAQQDRARAQAEAEDANVRVLLAMCKALEALLEQSRRCDLHREKCPECGA